MKFLRHSNGFFTLLAGLGLVLGGLLTGCGGGSDGGGATQTGTVAVLLTDAASDEFSEFKVTVNEVDLLSGNQPPVTIFSGPRQVDLLALEQVEDLFMIHEGVPAGTYNKIRLQVSSAEFVRTGESNSTKIDLGAGGNIDLVPNNTFSVSPGDALTIRLDLDIEKSILLGPALPNGFVFRPVVFVDVLSGLPVQLVRVSGEIVNDPDANSFLLRRTDPDFHDLGDGDENRPRLIRVDVSADTSIFNTNGLPSDFSSLVRGQHVHVRGLLSIDGGLHLDARLIEIGQFDRLRGTIESDVIDQSHFGFCPDPCADPSDPNDIIAVQMFPETLILGQIESGKRALIEGVMDNTGEFNAALIFVKPDGADLTRLVGTIQNLNFPDRTFNLISIPRFPLPEPIIPVHVMENALIFRIGREEDNHLRIERIFFDSLMDGDEAHVFGQFDVLGSPFHALEVITFATQSIP